MLELGSVAEEPTQAAPQHSHCAPAQKAQHPLQKKNPKNLKQHYSHQALLVLACGAGI